MPVTSSTGHSSMFESAFAFRYSTKVEANTKPSSPSPRIVAGTATTNASQWTTWKGIPKTSRPQTSVDASE